jgi:WD40 repeat protein
LSTNLEETEDVDCAIELRNGDVLTCDDGVLRIWRINNSHGELTKLIHSPLFHLHRLVLLPNGNVALSAEDSSVILVLSLEKEATVHLLSQHTSAIVSLIVLSNGHLASSSGYTVKVWDHEKGQLLNSFGIQIEARGGIIALPGERFAGVAEHSSKNVSIYDSNTGKRLMKLQGHEKEVLKLALLEDDHHMASSSEDLTIKIWNLENGIIVRTIVDSFRFLTPLADGVLASFECTQGPNHLKLWNWQTGELRTIALDHEYVVCLLPLKKSADNLALSCSSNSVRFFNF